MLLLLLNCAHYYINFSGSSNPKLVKLITHLGDTEHSPLNLLINSNEIFERRTWTINT